MQITFTIFFKVRCSNNYHIKNIKCFTQKQIIIWFKLNFNKVFFVFNWFFIIYYSQVLLSCFPKFFVIFSAFLGFFSVRVKLKYLIQSFFFNVSIYVIKKQIIIIFIIIKRIRTFCKDVFNVLNIKTKSSLI